MPTAPNPDNGSVEPNNGPDSKDTLRELFPQVYTELHRLAERYFRAQHASHTLQPTALVHEAYLKLSSQGDRRWDNRYHFYCVAANAMRQILVNHARDRSRLKRGGDRKRAALEELEAGICVSEDRLADLIDLDQALQALGPIDSRKARIVELRYFAGFSIEETARVLGISPTLVKSDWALAKAWLLRRISAGDPGEPPHDP